VNLCKKFKPGLYEFWIPLLVESSVSLLMDRPWSIDEGRSSSYNYFTRRYLVYKIAPWRVHRSRAQWLQKFVMRGMQFHLWLFSSVFPKMNFCHIQGNQYSFAIPFTLLLTTWIFRSSESRGLARLRWEKRFLVKKLRYFRFTGEDCQKKKRAFQS
jgi:hypothetical protein